MFSPSIPLRKIRTNFSSFEEISLFVRILLLTTILPAMLRFLSLPVLMKTLTPPVTMSNRAREMQDKIVKFTDYILGLNLTMYRSTCLKRSLLLYHFLSKVGFDVQICFGVRHTIHDREAKGLEGHAWLLFNGSIYLEKNIEAAKTYKVTYCFPIKRDHLAHKEI